MESATSSRPLLLLSKTSPGRWLFEKVAFHALWTNAERLKRKNYPRLSVLAPQDVLGWEIMIHGLYEENLLVPLVEKVLPFLGCDSRRKIALDVGANIGNHALFFSKYFKKIVAFEPNPNPAKILETNLFLNETQNVHLERIGLGEKAEEKVFGEVPDHLGGSSFSETVTALAGVRLKTLRIDRADAVLQRLGIQPSEIGLIKIDVEGMEKEVLSGMQSILHSGTALVLFESHHLKQTESVAAILRAGGYDRFFVMEPKRISFTPLKVLHRLIFGMQYALYRIRSFEDRFYPMIIAAKSSNSEAP